MDGQGLAGSAPTPVERSIDVCYEIQSGPYNNDFAPVGTVALGAAGFPSQNASDHDNVGSRVGFAYDEFGVRFRF
jgi:hypothetical protein